MKAGFLPALSRSHGISQGQEAIDHHEEKGNDGELP